MLDETLAAAARVGLEADRAAEAWMLSGLWLAGPDLLRKALAADTAPAKEAVYAHVNHGRWIVQCPACGGAQHTTQADPRFMCRECANVALGCRWRPVIWPADVDDINEVLAARETENQHWTPGETPVDLVAEQEAYVAQQQQAAADAADNDDPVLASDLEGHSHRYGKAVDGMVTCKTKACGLTVPVDVVEEDRSRDAAEKKAAR